MEPDQPLLEVGTIVKPHGLAGEVIVSFLSDRPERRAVGATFQTDRGVVTIASVSRHQQRWIVKFDAISGRDEAEEWRSTALRAPPLDTDDGTLWVHELVGCEVTEVSGRTRGIVASVQANPASDLLVLDTGALVPLTFVVGTPTADSVVVDVPNGLFELFGD